MSSVGEWAGAHEAEVHLIASVGGEVLDRHVGRGGDAHADVLDASVGADGEVEPVEKCCAGPKWSLLQRDAGLGADENGGRARLDVVGYGSEQAEPSFGGGVDSDLFAVDGDREDVEVEREVGALQRAEEDARSQRRRVPKAGFGASTINRSPTAWTDSASSELERSAPISTRLPLGIDSDSPSTARAARPYGERDRQY